MGCKARVIRIHERKKNVFSLGAYSALLGPHFFPNEENISAAVLKQYRLGFEEAENESIIQ
jgi:hypothetical protein